MSVMLAFAMAASLQATTLPPVDECEADGSFRQFRRDLVRALERKDVAHVTAALSPDVMIDFGGGHGRAAFVRAWGLESPRRAGSGGSCGWFSPWAARSTATPPHRRPCSTSCRRSGTRS